MIAALKLSAYTQDMAKSSKPSLSKPRHSKAKKINLGAKPKLSAQSPGQDTSEPRFPDTAQAEQLLASHGKPTQGLADLVSEYLSEPMSKFEQAAEWGKATSAPEQDAGPAL